MENNMLNKMKSVSYLKKLTFVVLFLLISNIALFSQSINLTLGTGGQFTIGDKAYTFLTLSQSTGYLSLNESIVLPYTTAYNLGVIYKGNERFLHNYGTQNTFLGINSGNFSTTGAYNTSMGFYSMNSNTTGYDNTAVGHYSLSHNTTGFNNTSVGFLSLCYNTTGKENSAFGLYSLSNNITGNKNSAVGMTSLAANIGGSENSAFGFESLRYNTVGVCNSAFGVNCLFNNTVGGYNSAVGEYSLSSNTSGYLNTALGYFSLANNTTGYYNTAVGEEALITNTTGNNNTAIGSYSQVPSGTSSNQVRIGNTAVTYAGVQVPWTITSDRRWKSDIQDSKLSLNFINKLRPVSYYRNNDEKQRTEYGFIAQEVEEVLKESGVDNSGMLTIDDNGMYELRYNDLLAPMVKSIQELKAENDELKAKLDKFEQMQNVLANEINKLRSKESEVNEVKLGEK
jgi:hypothetical protein